MSIDLLELTCLKLSACSSARLTPVALPEELVATKLNSPLRNLQTSTDVTTV